MNLNNNNNNYRIEYIDILRAFGIILMIMGHVGFGRRFDHFIHAFHMPLFFIISGMFFTFKPDYKNFISGKFKTLLVPYIIFGIFHYILWLVDNWSKVNYLSPLIHLLFINTYGLPTAGALWFLTAIFFTQIIYYVLTRFIINDVIKNAAVIIISLAGTFFPFELPWSLRSALGAVGLYHAGYLIMKYRDSGKIIHRILNLNLIETISAGILFTFMIFFNGYINVHLSIYAQNGGGYCLYWVNALGASLVGLNLSRIIHTLLQKNKLSAGLDSFLQSIGRNSIIYVCLNQLVIKFLSPYLHNRFIILAASILTLYILTLAVPRKLIQNIKFCLVMIIMLVISLGAVNYYHGKLNYAGRVRLPDVNKISANSLPEELSKNFALNLKYLLNTYWTSGQENSFLSSTNYNYAKDITPEQEKEISKGKTSFTDWKKNKYLYLPNTINSTSQENAVRPWGHLCFSAAAALRLNLYDENITGITRQDAMNMTVKLIASLAANHRANYIEGWGRAWQSALWSENIAFAAWLLWENLTDQEKYFVINMTIYEADRFINYRVPYYMDRDGKILHEGDSKSEENAWNSRILAIASCMLPEHENNFLWQEKLTELLLSSTSAPEDFIAHEILAGSNINSDGTVINHKLCHIDYMMTTLEGMIDSVIIYSLAGKEFPREAIFNADKIYNALVNLDLGRYDALKSGHYFYERDNNDNNKAGSKLNMPGVNDWGGKWYASCYLIDTEAEIFGLDKNFPDNLKASDWSREHLNYITRMINRQTTGQFFISGENNFVSGETYQIHNLCKACILRKLYESGMIY